jgi:signal transduction histidine kinase
MEPSAQQPAQQIAQQPAQQIAQQIAQQSAQQSAVRPPTEFSTSSLFPLPRKGNPPTLREEGGVALVLAGIAHDARNLVTALGLCAELISEPGVLAPRHGHFATEIRSIAGASAWLVQRLAELSRTATETTKSPAPEAPVTDLAEAVRQMESLLTAIAGPVTELEIACLPCPGQLQLTEESLSRILVNLVRNAADAMPTGGRIRIATQQGSGGSFLWTLDEDANAEQSAQYLWDDSPHAVGNTPRTVLLTIEDTGPGIRTDFMERVFEAGFSTRQAGTSWPESQHHGLGLSIVRQLVEAAGGTVRAVVPPSHGARFEIELPLTNVTPSLLSERALNDLGEPQ